MNMKKATKIVVIAVAVLFVGAVVAGVLNALLADGQWSFGWNQYQYDDSQFHIGGATVPSSKLSQIEVDWLGGSVDIQPCQDAFLSLSEYSDQELTEDGKLRWYVSEDGKALTVKYRASSSFFGNSGNGEKRLVLRVPERLYGQLKSFKISTKTASVTVGAIAVQQLSVNSRAGAITLNYLSCQTLVLGGENGEQNVLLNSMPKEITAKTNRGNVRMVFPKDASFALTFSSQRGKSPTVDFPTTQQNGVYLCGTGSCKITAQSHRGTFVITYP